MNIIGEVDLEVGGRKFTLRLSFLSCAQIEKAIDKSLIQLNLKSFSEKAACLAYCAKENVEKQGQFQENDISLDEAFKLVWNNKGPEITTAIAQLMAGNFNPEKKL